VQLRDLSREFIRQGHEITVILPKANMIEPWLIEEVGGVQVLRLRAPRTKDVGHIWRTIGEILMSFSMRRNFRKSPFSNRVWDGVVWYAPSIFHTPFVNFLKKTNGCRGYLIIRDIFPEWAVDIGLIGRGLPYLFFNAVARYQYSVADTIGIQSAGNQTYFNRWQKKPGRTLEVLKNWLGESVKTHCSIRVSKTILAGRKVFVHTGNMGAAQGLNIFLELAVRLHYRTDVGFLFVGRGSEAQRLQINAKALRLSNILFLDEIDPDEISDLYAQCHIGIVSLDYRHKSHNIPGKFLAYMQGGLPVLANLNAGNDLAALIRKEQVGVVCESNQLDELVVLAQEILLLIEKKSDLSSRCRQLFKREYSVESAVRQISLALLG
jgi:glycosyltransferase involved in cell wall biosynthesis